MVADYEAIESDPTSCVDTLDQVVVLQKRFIDER